MRKAGARASLSLVVACLPLAATAADYARTLALETVVGDVTAAIEAGRPLDEIQSLAAPLGVAFGQHTAGATSPPALAGLSVSAAALDLVLSQLALQAGANYHVALRQAQVQPEVLLVGAGVGSLDQLQRAADAAGLGHLIERTADGYVAHAPIAVWNGATLALQPGETLLLDRQAGAFLLASGHLSGTGATIRSTGASNPRLSAFNPFVVVAMSGTASFDAMTFADLGFGLFPPLTGVTVLESGFYNRTAPSTIRNSRFENIRAVAVVDAEGAVVDGNSFYNAPLQLSGGKALSAQGNAIVTGPNAHGIKVTNGARGVEIDGNIIVAAGLNGIFTDAGSADIAIRNNVIAGSARSGVSVSSADCIVVADNLLLQNAQSGLAVRDSAGLSVVANQLIANGNAGISVTHQPSHGVIDIAANLLDGNKVGIKGSTTARLAFAGNDFTGQAPRLLAGELVQFTDRFLDLRSDSDRPTIIDGLDLKAGAKLTPTGALRPTTCSYEGDA
jgi:poly(beta-D-mannuronate) C5 epimerase